MDISVEQFNKCKNKKEGYPFEIFIDGAEREGYPGMKSVYISRAFYKDFIPGGYVFFYHEDYLFILQGERLNDVFRKTYYKTKTFSYKEMPITNFEPARWLYFYWDKKFYFSYSDSCAG